MPGFPFARDSYYRSRVGSAVSDPFDVRVLDLPLAGRAGRPIARPLIDALHREVDSFRTRLVIEPDGAILAATIADAEPVVVTHEVACADAIPSRHLLASGRARSIDLVRGPAAEFHVYRSSAEGELRLRIVYSHFCLDFLSARQVREFASSTTGTPPAPRTGYVAWMEAYHRYAMSTDARRECAYWRAMDRGVFTAARACLSRGSETCRGVVTLEMGELELKALRVGAAACGCRAVHFVAAAIARALGQTMQLTHVPLNWTTHGRYPVAGRVFTRTFGWLSSHCPVVVDVRGDGVAAARSLQQGLARVPLAGCGYAWMARFREPDFERIFQTPFIVNVQEWLSEPVVGPRAVSLGEAYLAESREQVSSRAARVYIVVRYGEGCSIGVDVVDREFGVAERIGRTLKAELASCSARWGTSSPAARVADPTNRDGSSRTVPA